MKKFLAQITLIGTASKHVADDLLVEFDRCLYGVNNIRSVTLACNPQGVEIFKEIKGAKERRRIKEAFQSLKQKRLIKIEKQAKKISISLTRKGKLQSLRHQILTENKQLSEDDVCVIVFDIPEHVRTIRDQLRHFLKKAGCTQLQRSVWTTTIDIIRPLKALLKSMKAEKWIHVFQGQSVF
ncbi:CRISPR-associated endonuclease Cas2 [Patescibacteria group bacterium]|nr:CRISPR-associated endonuclease Cas2 [Patescibacteria group bacterium]MBU1705672.1 CRISPR-associated endonuclease Cas2 [Patescibacteria group bacterium]